jgi:GNAT superfamily N-acetyltransferase
MSALKDELDAGWVQVIESRDTLYLGQLYVAPSSQNRGIGTAILHELTDRARQGGKTLTLDVMKRTIGRACSTSVLDFRSLGNRTTS